MANSNFFIRDHKIESEGPPEGAPLGGTRSEAIRRLQVGVSGLFAMVVVMGIASAVTNIAQVAEDGAAPDAAPTTEPTTSSSQVDPLADAGVVPVVPTEPDVDEENDAEIGSPPVVPDIEPSPRSTAPARNNAPGTN